MGNFWSALDIFSLGCVLYEMLTGRRPFLSLAEVLGKDPEPPSLLVPHVNLGVDQAVLRCLRKDPARRFENMADLLAALEDSAAGAALPSRGRSMAPWRSGRRWVPAVVAIGLITILLAGIRWLPGGVMAPAARTVKFTLRPDRLVRGGDTEIDTEVSISRDGRHIAYVEADGGQLWLRDIDREEARPVPGATGVYQVFWPPNSRWVGYSQGQDCGIRPGCALVKIPAEGGSPVAIVQMQGAFRRAAWSPDGSTIVYCDSTGMYTVPSDGGATQVIVKHPHIEHPSFLDRPGKPPAILYQAVEEGPDHAIFVRIPGEPSPRQVIASKSSNPYPAYSDSTGHIIYVDGERQEAAVWAVPFSLDTLAPTGKPFRVAPKGSAPQVSRNGTLVYSDVPSEERQAAWVDRAGKVLAPIGEPVSQFRPTLSPDGRYLAVERAGREAGIWSYDLERGMSTRLTTEPGPTFLGAWSRSSDRVLYAAMPVTTAKPPRLAIFARRLAVDFERHLLFRVPAQPVRPLDSHPGGKYLLIEATSAKTRQDLLYLECQDGQKLACGEPVPFLQTPAMEGAAQFSPDGRWVVYVSDVSGRNEVYVRPFPSGSPSWQISVKGGTSPRWRKDGSEIYYVEQTRLMSVAVPPGSEFRPSAPVPLFERRSLARAIRPEYDVSADGTRFAVLEQPVNQKPLEVHVVHNWFEEFRNRE
ncbi:MAG: hypothetical protein FJW30_24215 [Acidobacteria bacterium]|nr:hypothetical protein [Acidobacteriota bacterium]